MNAINLFSCSGPNGVSLDEIARASNLSKPNLLYYFPSKSALYDMCARQAIDVCTMSLDALSADEPAGDQLRIIANKQHEIYLTYPGECRLFLRMFLIERTFLNPILADHFSNATAKATRLFKLWSANRQLQAMDVLTFLLIALLVPFQITALTREAPFAAPLEHQEYISSYKEFLFTLFFANRLH